MPGLFDPHVHIGVSDTFGDDAIATDFQYDTRDCLIGGVTTIATTTLIGRESLPKLSRAIKCGEARSWRDFKITSVVNTLGQVKQIPVVAKAGGVSYKFFAGYVGEQAEAFGMSRDRISPGLFYEACRQISSSVTSRK
jgi:dihydropyrimidinase/dihydroorotase